MRADLKHILTIYLLNQRLRMTVGPFDMSGLTGAVTGISIAIPIAYLARAIEGAANAINRHRDRRPQPDSGSSS